MKSTVNKFSKFRDDITNQEQWFEHMAEQGYILESCGVILTSFVKSDPMILKYKVVVREEIDLFGEEELLEHYAYRGWEFVCRGANQVFIFKSSDPDIDKISLFNYKAESVGKQIARVIFSSDKYFALIILLLGIWGLNIHIDSLVINYSKYGETAYITEIIIFSIITALGALRISNVFFEIKHILDWSKKSRK